MILCGRLMQADVSKRAAVGRSPIVSRETMAKE